MSTMAKPGIGTPRRERAKKFMADETPGGIRSCLWSQRPAKPGIHKGRPDMKLATLLAGGTAAAIATAAFAANPMVGGAPMYADRTIVENAVNSEDHKTLVAAVKAAGLVETLNSEGPFTVFAPVDSAFARLPEGTVDTLLKPENRDMLQKVLTAHVVAGDWSAVAIRSQALNSPDNFYHFEAVSGDALSAQVKGGALYIYDESGQAGRITISDVDQSNGVIHVIDTVLVPE